MWTYVKNVEIIKYTVYYYLHMYVEHVEKFKLLPM